MNAYFIPNGPKNIIPDFPSVVFGDVAEYYIQVADVFNAVFATSPINNIEKANCCEDRVRVHFLNYDCAMDAINFTLLLVEHETKSDTTTAAMPAVFDRTKHSHGRTNINASDILTISTIEYSEQNQQWLNELIDSPIALIEWRGIQGQADSYMPIVIQDTKVINRKRDDRYEYELQIQVKLSNERYIIRN